MSVLMRMVAIVVLAVFAVPRLPAAAQPIDPLGAASQTCDLIVRSQITIDRPVKEVWPSFLDMEAWIAGVRFQAIEGSRGEEGEVRRVSNAPDGNPTVSYFIKTVRVTPFEQYVVKVMPEKGARYFGFADFSFAEADDKTHLIYDVYIEMKVQGKNEEELRQSCGEQYASARRDFARNNLNLKRLVEGKQQRLRRAERGENAP